MIFGSQQGDTRIRRLLEELDIKYTITENDRFKILVEFDDGRSQIAFIDSDTYEFADFEIREVWSIGQVFHGIPDSSVMLRLLMHNEIVKIGSWRLIERSDQEFLAVFAAPIAAETNADALQGILRAVLETADNMEEELTGGADEF